MKKYIVREYKREKDGTLCRIEQYEIDENEIGETRTELNDIIGLCIDEYSIDEE